MPPKVEILPFDQTMKNNMTPNTGVDAFCTLSPSQLAKLVPASPEPISDPSQIREIIACHTARERWQRPPVHHHVPQAHHRRVTHHACPPWHEAESHRQGHEIRPGLTQPDHRLGSQQRLSQHPARRGSFSVRPGQQQAPATGS